MINFLIIIIIIELLTPDYLHTTKQNYGFFPDAFVEGTVLFKRNGIRQYSDYNIIILINI